MASAYVFCLVIGGVFVALSAFAGLDGVDFDQDFEADLEITDQGDKQGNTSIYQYGRRLWLPLFSLKFWTFGSCFFGLTGVLLHYLSPNLSPKIIAIISIIVGILCGTIMAWVLHTLKNSQVNSLVRSNDLVGLWGTVEIPFDRNSKGKIRVSVKGSVVAFTAFTEENREFTKKEKVFIVGVENSRVLVVSEDSLARSYDEKS
ncbi:MAG: NfeD-like protein [Trichodesmium sp. St16_bin4-tuft]|uniref:NfeD-like C-terminal domain-containing protein n=1 Tax=Trichodesmium erythraeum (strain IMS101) TaxID=203124 RepID=Q119N3_TRIEI|nr:NfeD-like protein [Trichodesmium erythraeum GBRTRLIN201]MCH2047001.1 NfeD-like protein [Trichodesmium sp. ALOHA_ZT_67]MDE5069077.1 NfeD-like protein [Trichodesmium sp. St4_bin8_1]MDE5072587.1 NfeD-like protein [Trichodesmium sp. St5_bin8]MDE5077921.1 NfeD-like protein [Trichodesmium sp. St2_bin6]MDE5095651.1 NfeD-like protein [Trichodesmium sp. St11_bin5]MDE5101387.1 NfeD-like protein [Trichodesmium sp. St16_bin4-tuft]MDE5102638.1 NfeD-like protein [Trichodesmium sp. St19_bin2]MDT9342055